MADKRLKMREVNTEYFRVFACLAVVLLHLNAWSFRIADLSGTMRIVHVFINTLVRFAVPGFMLITGTYVFGNADKSDWKIFYRKIVRKVILPTLFFSVICVAYQVLKGILIKKWILFDALGTWLHGTPMGHMWYMYMLIGFYIFLPVLCWIRRKLDIRLWAVLGICCIVLSAFFDKGDLVAPVWPLCWIQYVGYFIVGDCIGKKRKQRWIILPAIIVSVISWTCMFIYSLQKVHMGIRYDFQPQNIFTAVFSISLYLIFRNGREVRATVFQQKIAAQSTNIYFIHGIVINMLREVLDLTRFQYQCPLIFLAAGFVIVTAVCYWAGWMLNITEKRIGQLCQKSAEKIHSEIN